MLSATVNAYYVSSRVYTEMRTVSDSLKLDSDYNTILNVNSWVEQNYYYQFYWSPRNIGEAWFEKTGDCTDKALIKQKLLSYQNIWVHLNHGYVICPENFLISGNQIGLHDWITYQGIIIDSLYPICKFERIGSGVW